MNLRAAILLSMLALGLGGCRQTSAVKEVTRLVERCWAFVDTGTLRTRGLFPVHETSLWRAYEDRGAKLRIQYRGTSLDDLSCAVSNYEAVWSQDERDAVFQAIETAAPEWVASRNGTEVEDVGRSYMTDGDYRRRLDFRSRSSGSAFLVIQEQKETGFVTILTGKGVILN